MYQQESASNSRENMGLNADGNATSAQHPAQNTKSVTIEHTTIKSNRTFEDTRMALEASLPPINTTYSTLLAAGDVAGALAALQSLPVLNTFIVPPRNFGNLVRTLNKTGKAVQYEIGNPYTAARMSFHELGVTLYAPIRVLLREVEGVAMFEYDRPRSTMGQFGNEGVNEIAQELDRNLTALLMEAAGW
ncbi:hypothetical protein KVR01_009589 [Diaporthe batatas]|uniref:uncharacterized protein n=1 Tax=Diaporthe batatas TaxID=748121 RepID=UPI001D0438F6|nr:uncharacterized protein KVR01_009589 [Diaporthe batatas]KAG8161325.1 hypothetical protein KVR01_009589 [Diaporthe batatas]